MNKNLEIDQIDSKIISELQKDARSTYADIGKKIGSATATVHQRAEKLKEAGIITGSKVTVNYEKLGYEVCTFVGINLKNAKDFQMVLKNLEYFDEVVEAYYTTGNHNIFIKVYTKSIKELHNFLTTKLQNMDEVQSTETFISLDNPIHRDVLA